MKWIPQYRPIEEIMDEIGFISATNGWVLPRKRQSCKPVQYHLAPSSQGYDLHADLEIDGKHKVFRQSGRDEIFIQILNAVDRGEKPKVSLSMKHKYKTLKLPTN